MAEISVEDEFTRDWDWFAVDASGAIGHFTTAGLRQLPTSVKADNEAALRLIDYFDAIPRIDVRVEHRGRAGIAKG